MEEKKYYPLTEAQKVMFLNLSFSYKKAVTNICAVIDLFSEIDADAMLESMKISLKRNKSAAYRITKQNKETVQYFMENDEPENIELVDLSDCSDEELENTYNKWSKTPFPNKSLDVQLYRLRLVKKSNGFYAIYLCVSHVIFDAYAVMLMLNDVFAVYHAKLNGDPLPECNIDPIAMYQDDYKYYESEKCKKDIKYWDETVFDTEPHFTSIGGSNAKEFNKKKNFGTTLRLWQIKGNQINLPMEKPLVDKVNEYAAQHTMSPQNLFYLAIRTYLSKVCDGQEDVAIMNNLYRRGTRMQKKGGGTMVNVVMLRTRIPNSATFDEGCKNFNRTTQDVYRHGNYAFSKIIDLYSDKFKTPPTNGQGNSIYFF